MSDVKIGEKPSKKIKTLDEEIAAQLEKLRKLQERQREVQKKERERNQRAVLEILRTEKLDSVSADRWLEALPKIKEILATHQTSGKDQSEKKSSAKSETASAE